MAHGTPARHVAHLHTGTARRRRPARETIVATFPRGPRTAHVTLYLRSEVGAILPEPRAVLPALWGEIADAPGRGVLHMCGGSPAQRVADAARSEPHSRRSHRQSLQPDHFKMLNHYYRAPNSTDTKTHLPAVAGPKIVIFQYTHQSQLTTLFS
jgi:hypothetical protein